MSYNHDWKKDMDALVALTNTAWYGHRDDEKPKGVSGTVSLGKPKEEVKPKA